jgi:hypothetical protein
MDGVSMRTELTHDVDSFQNMYGNMVIRQKATVGVGWEDCVIYEVDKDRIWLLRGIDGSYIPRWFVIA